MYSVDTNIYLDWWVRRYPEDIFPNVRAQIEGLVSGRAMEGRSRSRR
jgi:hypothetical protein